MAFTGRLGGLHCSVYNQILGFFGSSIMLALSLSILFSIIALLARAGLTSTDTRLRTYKLLFEISNHDVVNLVHAL